MSPDSMRFMRWMAAMEAFKRGEIFVESPTNLGSSSSSSNSSNIFSSPNPVGMGLYNFVGRYRQVALTHHEVKGLIFLHEYLVQDLERIKFEQTQEGFPLFSKTKDIKPKVEKLTKNEEKHEIERQVPWNSWRNIQGNLSQLFGLTPKRFLDKLSLLLKIYGIRHAIEV